MAAAEVGAGRVQTAVHAHAVALVTLVLVQAGRPAAVQLEARGTGAPLSPRNRPFRKREDPN